MQPFSINLSLLLIMVGGSADGLSVTGLEAGTHQDFKGLTHTIISFSDSLMQNPYNDFHHFMV